MDSTPTKGTLVGAKSRFKWGHTTIIFSCPSLSSWENEETDISIIAALILGWMQVRNAISLSIKRDHVSESRLCVLILGAHQPDCFEEFNYFLIE